MATGRGDRLARGGAKAAFPASEGVTQNTWDTAFSDYDSEAYLKGIEIEAQALQARKAQKLLDEQAEAERDDREREEQRRRDALVEKTGVSGLSVGEVSLY